MKRMKQAVSALLGDPYGRLLTISRGLLKPWDTNLPGGKVEAGETLEEAVVREVFEETGIRIVDPRPVFKRVCNGKVDYECTTFTARRAPGSKPKLFTREGWLRWAYPYELYTGTFAKYNHKLLTSVPGHMIHGFGLKRPGAGWDDEKVYDRIKYLPADLLVDLMFNQEECYYPGP